MALQAVLMTRWRFAIVVMVCGLFKVLAGVYLYSRLASIGVLESPDGVPYSFEGNFIYVFGRNWDALELQDIAAQWYSSFRQFAWLPVFPSLIRVLSLGSGNYMGAAAVAGSFFGLAWIPVFQELCEAHMTRSEALFASLLFSFFPYVFVFTTVAYSESVFLFSSLLAWHMYRHGRLFACSVMISVASLTRVFGLFLLMPVVAGLVEEKRWRNLVYMLVPVLSFAGWMVYCYSRTGDLFAFRTAQGWPYFAQSSWFGEEMLPFLGGGDLAVYYLYPALVVLFVFLGLQTWGIDWRLGLYTVSQMFAILAFGGFPSYPRYLSFIFPLGLLLRTRSRVVVGVGVVFFALVCLLLWYTFLAYRWVA